MLLAELDDLQGEGTTCLERGKDFLLPLLPLDGALLLSSQLSFALETCCMSRPIVSWGAHGV